MEVWKYDLGGPGSICDVPMPVGAKVLDAQIQVGVIRLWALVDPAEPKEDRRFLVAGTGWCIGQPQIRFVATVQAPPLVWHVFEVSTRSALVEEVQP